MSGDFRVASDPGNCRTPAGESRCDRGRGSAVVWLRSHVERCLEDIWERFPLETDGGGDWPYRFGTAGCWVHVEPDGVGTVRVVAIAARRMKRSAKLLAEVNDVNARTLTAHAYFTGEPCWSSRPCSPAPWTGPRWRRLAPPWAASRTTSVGCWPRCSTGRPCFPEELETGGRRGRLTGRRSATAVVGADSGKTLSGC